MVVTTVATPTRSNSAVKPSNPNSHFAHTTPNGRQDVLALKQQLADALGENGPLYWDSLREFITGKLNRQEFDYFAHQYVKKNNAHLHNAFILATIHNALSDAPPPLKQRAIGWAKRKRGKDGSYRTAAGQGRDPSQKRLKVDVMSLSRVDREKLKLLLKASGDKINLLKDRRLAPRISKPPTIPFPTEQLPSKLPSADGLRPRMTTIAYESGLMGGVNEEVLEAMALALEIHIKSVISTTISKIRVNRTLGPKCANIRSVIRKEAQSLSSQNADAAIGSPGPSSPVNNGFALASPAPASSQTTKSSISDKPFIATKDLAFAFDLSPYILVETPLSAERVTTLIGDSEDEEDEYDDTDDELESDEGEFEI
ncbi:hypothetical protein INT44_008725 [Umbelopsis vinacea]|uniref:Transcriptional regulator of RNA polII, SAGA, subunit-domain-containing protein n=1 Tax=Umbelopsis vinacea TaxID=44442 RepID=A0A8H7PGB9_9FUNG|nr:hypothetical protein INT44_008725 [Umbelopsis vinacea]